MVQERAPEQVGELLGRFFAPRDDRGQDGGGDPMKQLIVVALVFSLALPAWPEVRAPPPPPDDDVPQLPREVPPVEIGYLESCFGVARVGSGPFGISREIAIPIGCRSSDGPPSLPV